MIAVQPNVPMAGLDEDKWRSFVERQIDQAEAALRQQKEEGKGEKEEGATVGGLA